MPRSGDPVVVTVGRQARPFTCHVCQSGVFAGYNVKLNTAVGFTIGARFAESAISLVCQGCRYVHTFVPGLVQLDLDTGMKCAHPSARMAG
jgi:hypothetical protein